MEWTIQSLQISPAAHYPGLALQGTDRVDFSEDSPLASGSKPERTSNCDAWNQQVRKLGVWSKVHRMADFT